MPSIAKTPNLGLSQHTGAEHIKREDYVADMLAIDNNAKVVSDAIVMKSDRYSAADSFPIGSSIVINHAACTVNTIIHIYPQENSPDDKVGTWSVESSVGSFTITSDTPETTVIPFIWEFFGGGQ